MRITLTAIALVAAAPLQGQTADLRYHAAVPATFVYTIEELEDDMTTRTVVELGLAPREGGVGARLVTRERQLPGGRPGRLRAPLDLSLTPRGPGKDDMHRTMEGVLMILPGRVVSVGESWTDTIRLRWHPAAAGRRWCRARISEIRL
jgi:hypothetical protein